MAQQIKTLKTKRTDFKALHAYQTWRLSAVFTVVYT